MTLDTTAFVSRGADGIVTDLTAFAPGEEVVVRGPRTPLGVVAVEFQSVYTGETGTITKDGSDYVLVTPSGRSVRVPHDVAQRRVPAGVQSGATYSATIWTDPKTGEATALKLDAQS